MRPRGAGHRRQAVRRRPSAVGLVLTLVAGPMLATAEGLAAQSGAPAAPAKSVPSKTGYIPANGVRYYYEIHGTGEPLLLLHGGLGSIDMFGPVLAALAKERQVIGVDLHGHGRTALGDRPISMEAMGDDLALVLKELGYDRGTPSRSGGR